MTDDDTAGGEDKKSQISSDLLFVSGVQFDFRL